MEVERYSLRMRRRRWFCWRCERTGGCDRTRAGGRRWRWRKSSEVRCNKGYINGLDGRK